MKFKKIPKEYFITILDRLTRFEPASSRYKRVIEDIINKFALDIQAKSLSIDEQIYLAVEIFNSSVDNKLDDYLNTVLMELEEYYFKFNKESYQYLSARFNISSMINKISYKEIKSKNLYWLKRINDERRDINLLRQEEGLLYPIQKIILCEGQTEYTLLKVIFNLMGYNLDKQGIYVLPAGGKNQVARKYYSLVEYINIPFFILLDKDAESIKELILPKLRPNDTIYLIKKGEFEDIIPIKLLKNAINSEHSSEIDCQYEDFLVHGSMVENIKEIYRKYGFGDFKKAHFALTLRDYILSNASKEDFLDSEIVDILNLLK